MGVLGKRGCRLGWGVPWLETGGAMGDLGVLGEVVSTPHQDERLWEGLEPCLAGHIGAS